MWWGGGNNIKKCIYITIHIYLCKKISWDTTRRTYSQIRNNGYFQVVGLGVFIYFIFFQCFPQWTCIVPNISLNKGIFLFKSGVDKKKMAKKLLVCLISSNYFPWDNKYLLNIRRHSQHIPKRMLIFNFGNWIKMSILNFGQYLSSNYL